MSIEVSGVTRFFGSTRAVWQMDMSVPAGTITGLVGPNGAGKTTLLLMLAALLAPDTGEIQVAGLDPVTQARQVHRAVGWMPDTFGTWDTLTCTEILHTFAAAQGLDRATARARTEEMLSTVHLDDMARTTARVLSRGQKQRLGLARALIHSPQVLLLDEPAAGMDPRSRADLRNLLRDLADDGVTVLISSHILAELEQMVDGVVFMSEGKPAKPFTSREKGKHVHDSDEGTDNDATSVGDPHLPDPHEQELSSLVHPQWGMKALNAQRLASWAATLEVETGTGPDGSLRLDVPDNVTASRLLREAVEAGVHVVSFGPVGGSLEEIYLSIEGERR
ncbi:ATP-binding cassette domain-containing protein [Actinomyces weissii]|uniref:ATP-binding cassette domain-containing protein n=1 Tax=Actinomyces weissii TaxID=675090 RepID=A0A7T7M9I0_9ACTO|nr:ATP-binding cassette domain-containing protein [Actinomyces weissii]QQM67225.1 ATP-binding cassette domain-containing protein [Actinomyces weissii]